MGSHSLESGARFTPATDNYGIGTDLDDSLIHQALSVYQAGRNTESGMINCFPKNRNEHNVELTIDLPYDGDRRHSHGGDSGNLFPKSYNCSAISRLDPSPIDERIVSCSPRVRVEQEPGFGCSTHIRIDIDVPGFYLCSAHIKLRPEPSSQPPDAYLCAWHQGNDRPTHPPGFYMCVSRPWDRPGHHRPDIDLCVARIDTQHPHRPDIDLCVARIDTRHPHRTDIDLCVARIDTRHPHRTDIILCADKVRWPDAEPSNITLCAAKVEPGNHSIPSHVYACVDHKVVPINNSEDPDNDPDTRVLGCGKKVPGEPGHYRLCSANAPNDYIPEFLEYEKQTRRPLI